MPTKIEILRVSTGAAMSTAGKFKVITAPNDVFLETDVGDFAIYSTNGVFVGALPAGVVGKAHMKFDEEGIVANEPISALAGVSGDVRTGSIVPIMSAAGIQIDSGAGTIRLDSVVVDNNHVTCDDLTTVTVTGASNVTTVQLTLPTATVTCPTGMTAVRLAPASPLLDIQNTDGSDSTLRVRNITVNNITTDDSAALHVADSLLVDADIEIGTTMRVHGASVLDSTLRVDGASLTLGDGSSSSIVVSAPYLGISALTQVPFLRFDSGTVLDNNTWGARNAARATFGGFPAFYEGNGIVLKDITTGPAAGLTSAMCVRNLNGSVTTVFVDNGLMTRHAPTVAGPSTLVDATGAKTATTFVNVRNDLECSVQIAAPSYRLLGSLTADEVLLTAPAAGLTVDKRVIAPMYRIAAEADLTPIAGGGTEFSTKINVPQIVLRNASNATTVATHQTDSDGSARIVAPTLRLAGDMEVQLRPTAGGTQITPGVLDLSYNTALASIAYLRVMADETGLRLYTPRLYFEGTSSSLISSVSTGTLTMSNLPTLSLNGICTITATTALSKTKTSIVADTLELGTTIKKTIIPEAGGVLLGPESDFTLRSATRLALQSATSVDFVMRKQPTATSTDTTYTTFKFQAGSKGELRLNGRDIGLTPYDALGGAVSSSVADINAWYTYRDSAGADLFRARRYDNGRPFLLSTDAPTTLVPTPINSFVIPGFVNSLFSGTASTTYVNPLGGTLAFQGAWVDITVISQAGAGAALSLRHLQTVLLNGNQTDRRPAVWRLFARDSETSSVVTDWKLVMQGGTSEITYPSDRELPVYAAYRLAVSIVTSGDEVRLSALNMWGVNAALTPVPQSSFTGQHYTVPASGVDASELRPGMVVVSSGEHDSINTGGFKARGGRSSITSDAALPRVMLTDQAADRRVFGVVDSWRNNEWVNYVDKRLLVNSLGEGAVLVCSKNGPIRNGDLLQTSSVRGYAERQDSDCICSYTVGKATMDCDFEPKLVPKMRVVVDERGVPAMDSDGLVIWEPTGETEREYDTLRMTSQGVTVAMISVVYMSG
jgi:hypothetical protein